MFRQSVGDCPICGQSHTSCTASSGPIMVTQTPARDAAAEQDRPLLVAEVVQAGLPEGTFTSGTYHKKAKRVTP